MKATDINLEALLTDSEETDYQFMIKFFKPEQVLGLGAFSIVIKAYDILSRKNVAIKILEKSLHNSMCMEILKKEAEILD